MTEIANLALFVLTYVTLILNFLYLYAQRKHNNCPFYGACIVYGSLNFEHFGNCKSQFFYVCCLKKCATKLKCAEHLLVLSFLCFTKRYVVTFMYEITLSKYWTFKLVCVPSNYLLTLCLTVFNMFSSHPDINLCLSTLSRLQFHCKKFNLAENSLLRLVYRILPASTFNGSQPLNVSMQAGSCQNLQIKANNRKTQMTMTEMISSSKSMSQWI